MGKVLYIIATYRRKNWAQRLSNLTTIAELFGVTIFKDTLLDHIQHKGYHITIRIISPNSPEVTPRPSKKAEPVRASVPTNFIINNLIILRNTICQHLVNALHT